MGDVAMEERAMTQAQMLETAKILATKRVNTSDFLQVGDYSWISVEVVNGVEVPVEILLRAKKNYDLDEALEDYEFEKNQKQKKAKEKADAKQKELEKSTKRRAARPQKKPKPAENTAE